MKPLFAHRSFIIIDLLLLGVLASLYGTSVYSFQNYSVRLVLFGAGLVYLVLISTRSGFSREQLGLSFRQTREAIRDLTLPVALLIGLVVLARFLTPDLFRLELGPLTWSSILVRLGSYALLSVPIQELAFRGYAISRLEQFTHSPTLLMLISAFIFSFMHWPFGNLAMSIGSFVLGLLFARNFIRYRDLTSVMLAHWIIGAALLPCLISI